MNRNEHLIYRFYTAFQKKDFRTMQECYADTAMFSDPVFPNLNATQVRAMWEMFCVKSRDLKIEFQNIRADEKTGSAEWIATYPFSANGNRVINHITANFVFEDEKIVRHRDHFNFHKWAGQALGLSGKLLGWMPFVRNKTQKAAMKALNDYMSKKSP
ncbi:nuclear transport factor 2 family protein [Flavihumibacter sp. R14]|nr:nuclear transport factor 2 family protein [Flavihumibacter soli]